MPENDKSSRKAADSEPTRLPEATKNRKFDKNCQSNQNCALTEPNDTQSDVIASFTPEEVRYFLDLYYDVIATDSKPEVLMSFYQSCQSLLGDDYDAVIFLPAELENSRNKDVNNNTPSKAATSEIASETECLDNSKSSVIANSEFNEDLGRDWKSLNRTNDVIRSTLDDNGATNKQYYCVDSEVEKDLKIKVFMAHLLWSQLEAFPDFLCDILARNDRGDESSQIIRQMSLLILDILLSTRGLHTNLDIVNNRLPLGDSPLIRAVRARDYDVILLLLRNGADVTRSWMNFSCPLELLLFSPTLQAQLNGSGHRQLLRCLQLLLSAMISIPWEHLRLLEAWSYHPLIPNWKKELEDGLEEAWGSRTGPPSLIHLCGGVVRAAALTSRAGLQGCVPKLPLPNSLKNYVTLSDIV